MRSDKSSTPRSFPRTRGDAPASWIRSARVATLPPHTRGCTVDLAAGAEDAQASPAHAGMHRTNASRSAGGRRFPRTRGDAPHSATSPRPPSTLPPHTRGCTCLSIEKRHSDTASPAHAGMHRSPGRHPAMSARFPRTRGDASGAAGRLARGGRLPPHTRGCTHIGGDGSGAPHASPAHAGMHLTLSSTAAAWASFPRTRGDAPRRRPRPGATPPLPPHTRGCTFSDVFRLSDLRASPAHAGMHLSAATSSRA